MRPQSWIWLILLFLLATFAILNPRVVEALPSYAPTTLQFDSLSFSASSDLTNTTLAGKSLRFLGNGTGDIDRVKIAIDNPTDDLPGPPADVGATDFTIEFWLRSHRADNQAAAIECGEGIEWINGNIVVDRDRYNQERKFGISLTDGRVAWGVSSDDADFTLCGTSDLRDNQWHHIAVTRRMADGVMTIFVDGKQEATGDGPDGDVSYPDAETPGDFCDGPCINSDPYLVIGAEKHDAGPAYPSFSGWIDELRLSTVVRYTANFTRPMLPFTPDKETAALYHFDEVMGNTVVDSSGAEGGPSNGELKVGGDPSGPIRFTSDAPLNGPLSVKTHLAMIAAE